MLVRNSVVAAESSFEAPRPHHARPWPNATRLGDSRSRGLLEEPLRLALQAWLGVGIGLHSTVDILAVIQPDRPLVHFFDGLCRLGSVLGILAGFLEHVGAIGHQRDLERHVVQRTDGVLERHLPWFEFADGGELGVGRLDGGVHRVQRGLWQDRSKGGSETIESWRSAILSNLAQSAEISASGERLMVGEEQATNVPNIARRTVRKVMRRTLPPAAGYAQADSEAEYPGRCRLAKRWRIRDGP